MTTPEPESEELKEEEEKEEEEGEEEPEIFRKKPSEAYSNLEQLDQLLVVVQPRLWIALYTLLAMVLLFVLWAIFGSISIKVNGRGIVMTPEGLFSIQSRTGGTVMSLDVKPGDLIKTGEQVAEIFDPEEAIKLKDAQLKVVNVTRDLKMLMQEIATEGAAQKAALKSEIAAQEYKIKKLNDEVEADEKDLATRQKLVDQGLISVALLREAQTALIEKRIELETNKGSLENLKAEYAKSYRQEELRQKQQELFQVIAERDLLETRLKLANVKATTSGKVIELLVNVGELVSPGTPLLWLERLSSQNLKQVVFAFFPVEKGKNIAVGQQVLIALTSVEVNQYGYLLGRVSAVSQYAVSSETISTTIHNKGLIEYFLAGSPAVMEAEIELERDPSTPTGYRWTAGSGPNTKITTGTVAEVKAIVGRIRPIYYVIPITSLNEKYY